MIVECEGCGRCDCDAPGLECTGGVFKIIWRDEKYDFLSVFEAVGLTDMNAALDSLCSSGLFLGENTMSPRSFPGTAKTPILFGTPTTCIRMVKHLPHLHSPEQPVIVLKHLNMPV